LFDCSSLSNRDLARNKFARSLPQTTITRNQNKKTTRWVIVLFWLAWAEEFRNIYLSISPLRFKEIRDLVDDYEAGRLDLIPVEPEK